MTKGGVFWCIEILNFSKNRGLGSISNIYNTNTYQVIPLIQGIDKIMSIVQIIVL